MHTYILQRIITERKENNNNKAIAHFLNENLMSLSFFTHACSAHFLVPMKEVSLNTNKKCYFMGDLLSVMLKLTQC